MHRTKVGEQGRISEAKKLYIILQTRAKWTVAMNGSIYVRRAWGG